MAFAVPLELRVTGFTSAATEMQRIADLARQIAGSVAKPPALPQMPNMPSSTALTQRGGETFMAGGEGAIPQAASLIAAKGEQARQDVLSAGGTNKEAQAAGTATRAAGKEEILGQIRTALDQKYGSGTKEYDTALKSASTELSEALKVATDGIRRFVAGVSAIDEVKSANLEGGLSSLKGLEGIRAQIEAAVRSLGAGTSQTVGGTVGPLDRPAAPAPSGAAAATRSGAQPANYTPWARVSSEVAARYGSWEDFYNEDVDGYMATARAFGLDRKSPSAPRTPVKQSDLPPFLQNLRMGDGPNAETLSVERMATRSNWKNKSRDFIPRQRSMGISGISKTGDPIYDWDQAEYRPETLDFMRAFGVDIESVDPRISTQRVGLTVEPPRTPTAGAGGTRSDAGSSKGGGRRAATTRPTGPRSETPVEFNNNDLIEQEYGIVGGEEPPPPPPPKKAKPPSETEAAAAAQSRRQRKANTAATTAEESRRQRKANTAELLAEGDDEEEVETSAQRRSRLRRERIERGTRERREREAATTTEETTPTPVATPTKPAPKKRPAKKPAPKPTAAPTFNESAVRNEYGEMDPGDLRKFATVHLGTSKLPVSDAEVIDQLVALGQTPDDLAAAAAARRAEAEAAAAATAEAEVVAPTPAKKKAPAKKAPAKKPATAAGGGRGSGGTTRRTTSPGPEEPEKFDYQGAKQRYTDLFESGGIDALVEELGGRGLSVPGELSGEIDPKELIAKLARNDRSAFNRERGTERPAPTAPEPVPVPSELQFGSRSEARDFFLSGARDAGTNTEYGGLGGAKYLKGMADSLGINYAKNAKSANILSKLVNKTAPKRVRTPEDEARRAVTDQLKGLGRSELEAMAAELGVSSTGKGDAPLSDSSLVTRVRRAIERQAGGQGPADKASAEGSGRVLGEGETFDRAARQAELAAMSDEEILALASGETGELIGTPFLGKDPAKLREQILRREAKSYGAAASRTEGAKPSSGGVSPLKLITDEQVAALTDKFGLQTENKRTGQPLAASTLKNYLGKYLKDNGLDLATVMAEEGMELAQPAPKPAPKKATAKKAAPKEKAAGAKAAPKLSEEAAWLGSYGNVSLDILGQMSEEQILASYQGTKAAYDEAGFPFYTGAADSFEAFQQILSLGIPGLDYDALASLSPEQIMGVMDQFAAAPQETKAAPEAKPEKPAGPTTLVPPASGIGSPTPAATDTPGKRRQRGPKVGWTDKTRPRPGVFSGPDVTTREGWGPTTEEGPYKVRRSVEGEYSLIRRRTGESVMSPQEILSKYPALSSLSPEELPTGEELRAMSEFSRLGGIAGKDLAQSGLTQQQIDALVAGRTSVPMSPINALMQEIAGYSPSDIAAFAEQYGVSTTATSGGTNSRLVEGELVPLEGEFKSYVVKPGKTGQFFETFEGVTDALGLGLPLAFGDSSPTGAGATRPEAVGAPKPYRSVEAYEKSLKSRGNVRIPLSPETIIRQIAEKALAKGISPESIPEVPINPSQEQQRLVDRVNAGSAAGLAELYGVPESAIQSLLDLQGEAEALNRVSGQASQSSTALSPQQISAIMSGMSLGDYLPTGEYSKDFFEKTQAALPEGMVPTVDWFKLLGIDDKIWNKLLGVDDQIRQAINPSGVAWTSGNAISRLEELGINAPTTTLSDGTVRRDLSEGAKLQDELLRMLGLQSGARGMSGYDLASKLNELGITNIALDNPYVGAEVPDEKALGKWVDPTTGEMLTNPKTGMPYTPGSDVAKKAGGLWVPAQSVSSLETMKGLANKYGSQGANVQNAFQLMRANREFGNRAKMREELMGQAEGVTFSDEELARLTTQRRGLSAQEAADQGPQLDQQIQERLATLREGWVNERMDAAEQYPGIGLPGDISTKGELSGYSRRTFMVEPILSAKPGDPRFRTSSPDPVTGSNMFFQNEQEAWRYIANRNLGGVENLPPMTLGEAAERGYDVRTARGAGLGPGGTARLVGPSGQTTVYPTPEAARNKALTLATEQRNSEMLGQEMIRLRGQQRQDLRNTPVNRAVELNQQRRSLERRLEDTQSRLDALGTAEAEGKKVNPKTARNLQNKLMSTQYELSQLPKPDISRSEIYGSAMSRLSDLMENMTPEQEIRRAERMDRISSMLNGQDSYNDMTDAQLMELANQRQIYKQRSGEPHMLRMPGAPVAEGTKEFNRQSVIETLRARNASPLPAMEGDPIDLATSAYEQAIQDAIEGRGFAFGGRQGTPSAEGAPDQLTRYVDGPLGDTASMARAQAMRELIEGSLIGSEGFFGEGSSADIGKMVEGLAGGIGGAGLQAALAEAGKRAAANRPTPIPEGQAEAFRSLSRMSSSKFDLVNSDLSGQVNASALAKFGVYGNVTGDELLGWLNLERGSGTGLYQGDAKTVTDAQRTELRDYYSDYVKQARAGGAVSMAEPGEIETIERALQLSANPELNVAREWSRYGTMGAEVAKARGLPNNAYEIGQADAAEARVAELNGRTPFEFRQENDFRAQIERENMIKASLEQQGIPYVPNFRYGLRKGGVAYQEELSNLQKYAQRQGIDPALINPNLMFRDRGPEGMFLEDRRSTDISESFAANDTLGARVDTSLTGVPLSESFARAIQLSERYSTWEQEGRAATAAKLGIEDTGAADLRNKGVSELLGGTVAEQADRILNPKNKKSSATRKFRPSQGTLAETGTPEEILGAAAVDIARTTAETLSIQADQSDSGAVIKGMDPEGVRQEVARRVYQSAMNGAAAKYTQPAPGLAWRSGKNEVNPNTLIKRLIEQDKTLAQGKGEEFGKDQTAAARGRYGDLLDSDPRAFWKLAQERGALVGPAANMPAPAFPEDVNPEAISEAMKILGRDASFGLRDGERAWTGKIVPGQLPPDIPLTAEARKSMLEQAKVRAKETGQELPAQSDMPTSGAMRYDQYQGVLAMARYLEALPSMEGTSPEQLAQIIQRSRANAAMQQSKALTAGEVMEKLGPIQDVKSGGYNTRYNVGAGQGSFQLAPKFGTDFYGESFKGMSPEDALAALTTDLTRTGQELGTAFTGRGNSDVVMSDVVNSRLAEIGKSAGLSDTQVRDALKTFQRAAGIDPSKYQEIINSRAQEAAEAIGPDASVVPTPVGLKPNETLGSDGSTFIPRWRSTLKSGVPVSAGAYADSILGDAAATSPAVSGGGYLAALGGAGRGGAGGGGKPPTGGAAGEPEENPFNLGPLPGGIEYFTKNGFLSKKGLGTVNAYSDLFAGGTPLDPEYLSALYDQILPIAQSELAGTTHNPEYAARMAVTKFRENAEKMAAASAGGGAGTGGPTGPTTGGPGGPTAGGGGRRGGGGGGDSEGFVPMSTQGYFGYSDIGYDSEGRIYPKANRYSRIPENTPDPERPWLNTRGERRLLASAEASIGEGDLGALENVLGGMESRSQRQNVGVGQSVSELLGPRYQFTDAEGNAKMGYGWQEEYKASPEGFAARQQEVFQKRIEARELLLQQDMIYTELIQRDVVSAAKLNELKAAASLDPEVVASMANAATSRLQRGNAVRGMQFENEDFRSALSLSGRQGIISRMIRSGDTAGAENLLKLVNDPEAFTGAMKSARMQAQIDNAPEQAVQRARVREAGRTGMTGYMMSGEGVATDAEFGVAKRFRESQVRAMENQQLWDQYRIAPARNRGSGLTGKLNLEETFRSLSPVNMFNQAASMVTWMLPMQMMFGMIRFLKEIMTTSIEIEKAWKKAESQFSLTYGSNAQGYLQSFGKNIQQIAKETNLPQVQLFEAGRSVMASFGPGSGVRLRDTVRPGGANYSDLTLVNEQMKAISEFSYVTGREVEKTKDEFQTIGLAFGITGRAAGDMLISAERVYGVRPDQLSQGIADSATIAAQAGFRPEEYTALVAETERRAGSRSAVAVSESLNRALADLPRKYGDLLKLREVLPELQTPEFSKAMAQGDTVSILTQVSAVAASIKTEQDARKDPLYKKSTEDLILTTLGSQRNDKDFWASLQSLSKIMSGTDKRYEQFVRDSAGGLGERYSTVQGSLKGQMSQMIGTIQQVFVQIANSGVIAAFANIIGVAGGLLKGFAGLFSLVEKLNTALRDSIRIFVEFGVTAKILQAIFTRMAIIGSSPTAGPLAQILGLGAVSMGGVPPGSAVPRVSMMNRLLGRVGAGLGIQQMYPSVIEASSAAEAAAMGLGTGAAPVAASAAMRSATVNAEMVGASVLGAQATGVLTREGLAARSASLGIYEGPGARVRIPGQPYGSGLPAPLAYAAFYGRRLLGAANNAATRVGEFFGSDRGVWSQLTENAAGVRTGLWATLTGSAPAIDPNTGQPLPISKRDFRRLGRMTPAEVDAANAAQEQVGRWNAFGQRDAAFPSAVPAGNGQPLTVPGAPVPGDPSQLIVPGQTAAATGNAATGLIVVQNVRARMAERAAAVRGLRAASLEVIDEGVVTPTLPPGQSRSVGGVVKPKDTGLILPGEPAPAESARLILPGETTPNTQPLRIVGSGTVGAGAELPTGNVILPPGAMPKPPVPTGKLIIPGEAPIGPPRPLVIPGAAPAVVPELILPEAAAAAGPLITPLNAPLAAPTSETLAMAKTAGLYQLFMSRGSLAERMSAFLGRGASAAATGIRGIGPGIISKLWGSTDYNIFGRMTADAAKRQGMLTAFERMGAFAPMGAPEVAEGIAPVASRAGFLGNMAGGAGPMAALGVSAPVLIGAGVLTAYMALSRFQKTQRESQQKIFEDLMEKPNADSIYYTESRESGVGKFLRESILGGRESFESIRNRAYLAKESEKQRKDLRSVLETYGDDGAKELLAPFDFSTPGASNQKMFSNLFMGETEKSKAWWKSATDWINPFTGFGLKGAQDARNYRDSDGKALPSGVLSQIADLQNKVRARVDKIAPDLSADAAEDQVNKYVNMALKGNMEGILKGAEKGDAGAVAIQRIVTERAKKSDTAFGQSVRNQQIEKEQKTKVEEFNTTAALPLDVMLSRYSTGEASGSQVLAMMRTNRDQLDQMQKEALKKGAINGEIAKMQADVEKQLQDFYQKNLETMQGTIKMLAQAFGATPSEVIATSIAQDIANINDKELTPEKQQAAFQQLITDKKSQLDRFVRYGMPGQEVAGASAQQILMRARQGIPVTGKEQDAIRLQVARNYLDRGDAAAEAFAGGFINPETGQPDKGAAAADLAGWLSQQKGPVTEQQIYQYEVQRARQLAEQRVANANEALDTYGKNSKNLDPSWNSYLRQRVGLSAGPKGKLVRDELGYADLTKTESAWVNASDLKGIGADSALGRSKVRLVYNNKIGRWVFGGARGNPASFLPDGEYRQGGGFIGYISENEKKALEKGLTTQQMIEGGYWAPPSANMSQEEQMAALTKKMLSGGFAGIKAPTPGDTTTVKATPARFADGIVGDRQYRWTGKEWRRTAAEGTEITGPNGVKYKMENGIFTAEAGQEAVRRGEAPSTLTGKEVGKYFDIDTISAEEMMKINPGAYTAKSDKRMKIDAEVKEAQINAYKAQKAGQKDVADKYSEQAKALEDLGTMQDAADLAEKDLAAWQEQMQGKNMLNVDQVKAKIGLRYAAFGKNLTTMAATEADLVKMLAYQQSAQKEVYDRLVRENPTMTDEQIRNLPAYRQTETAMVQTQTEIEQNKREREQYARNLQRATGVDREKAQQAIVYAMFGQNEATMMREVGVMGDDIAQYRRDANAVRDRDPLAAAQLDNQARQAEAGRIQKIRQIEEYRRNLNRAEGQQRRGALIGLYIAQNGQSNETFDMQIDDIIKKEKEALQDESYYTSRGDFLQAAQARNQYIQLQAEEANKRREKRNWLRDLANAEADTFKIIAESHGDTVGAAKYNLQNSVRVLNDMLANRQDFTPAQIKQQQNKIISDTEAARQAQYNYDVSLVDFNMQMQRITDGQAIARLRAIQAANADNEQLVRDIELKIRGIQQAAEMQYNLPEMLALPTFYMTRRLNQESAALNLAAQNANTYNNGTTIGNLTIVLPEGADPSTFLAAWYDATRPRIGVAGATPMI